MPLSRDEFILTRRVVTGVVDAEPIALAIRFSFPRPQRWSIYRGAGRRVADTLTRGVR